VTAARMIENEILQSALGISTNADGKINLIYDLQQTVVAFEVEFFACLV
jgi:hypothetical protein